MGSVEMLSRSIGIRKACQSLGVPRSSVYSARRTAQVPAKQKTSPRALAAEEKSKGCVSFEL